MLLPIICSNYLNDLQLTKEDPKETQRQVSPLQLLPLPTYLHCGINRYLFLKAHGLEACQKHPKQNTLPQI